MKSGTAHPTLPAISPLTEDDPILARMQELGQSIVRRAYELFKESGFNDRHDLEEWQRAVSELLEPVSVEIREADEEISMRAEVPGFTEQEIEVKVDAYRVFIAGKQEDSSESQEDESVCSERKAKEFLREYRLSAEIDPERVTAELKDGVLDIRLPKCVRSAEVEAESTAA